MFFPIKRKMRLIVMITYIGYLDDPDFHWRNGDYNGNIPKRKSPEVIGSFNVCLRTLILDGIKEGIMIGEQTNWAHL